MNNNIASPKSRSNFANSFKGNGNFSSRKAPTKRIFMQVHSINSYQDFPTVAFGIDLKTKEQIAVRLTTTQERTDDLMKIYKNLNADQAKQRAKNEYQGSNKRESLDDKRDKRNARFLSFDHCIAIDPLDDGTPFYRSHWSELVSSNAHCSIFEGMAHLYLNAEKNIAILKVIEFISELEQNNQQRNVQIVLNTLKNQFKNGLKRMGSCVIQVIDGNGAVIAEPSIFQAYHKEPAKNRNGDEYEVAIYANEDESLSAFMTKKALEPQAYDINIDLGRVGLSVLAGIPFDEANFCYQSNDYFALMADAKSKFESGEYQIRIVSLNEIFCGPERRNRLLQKAQKKGIVTNYSVQETVTPDNPEDPPFERTIAMYLPTVFALHYHQDSGNPFIAYNIISEQFSSFPPTQLWQMPKDLGGYKYRILHNDV